MMRSLFSGVSGLKTHQTRMDVIGNNIANINTIGFKSSRTTFSDMFSQMQLAASSATETRGGINPRQIGLGVNVESIDLLFNDASPQQTGKNTDLALSGNGLFVLKSDELSYYTRNGAFMFDEQGYYVLPGSGLRVQGWNATEEGVINTNALATDVIVPVGKTMEATATNNIDYSGNLNKESLIITSIQATQSSSASDADFQKVAITTKKTAYESSAYSSVNVDGESCTSARITLSDGTTLNVTSGYYEVGCSVPITTLATVYDSLGGKHQVTLLIDKDPTSTDYNFNTDDAAAAATAGTRYLVTVGENTYIATVTARDTDGNPTEYTYTDNTGTKHTTTTATEQTVYDNRWRVYIAPGKGEQGPSEATDANYQSKYERSVATGNPESDGSSTTGLMNHIQYLYFSSNGVFISNGQENPGNIMFNYSDGNGAESGQQVDLDFSGLSQYASNTTSFPTSNGNTSGVLQSVAVDGNGIISGTYTNGLVRNEAQIAIAQFANAGGLTKVGTTIYQESNNSGEANIKTVADFGLSVISSALEMSNVDIATEFSDMIITQRGFQANSKMTTVSDEMLETLVNMKR